MFTIIVFLLMTSHQMVCRDKAQPDRDLGQIADKCHKMSKMMIIIFFKSRKKKKNQVAILTYPSNRCFNISTLFVLFCCLKTA